MATYSPFNGNSYGSEQSNLDGSLGTPNNGYPLVNVNKKLLNITILNGDLSTISIAIVNSYVSLPKGKFH